MTTLLPVSAAQGRVASDALAAEVRKRVREQSLVVWLDADGHYGELVDALARGELGFPYPVMAFRGSYLELMFALEPYGKGPDPEHLLVHLPGLTRDSVKATPAYGVAAAGRTYERNLGTLVREVAVGIARPDEVDAFVRAPGLTLERADVWLEELAAKPRDGLSLLLQSLGVEDVVMALLAQDRRFQAHLPRDGDTLLSFLERGLGLGPAWRRFRLGDAELRPEVAAALVASWLMAVEFVCDLKEPAVTPELAALAGLGPFAKVSRGLAARFRAQLPDIYEELEGGLHALLERERTSHHAEALGAIDTFRFEESAMRAAALDALRKGDWDRAHEVAVDRTTEGCFWVQRSATLQRTWELVRLAAHAGRGFTRQARGLDRCASLEEATTRYAEKLAPVDRAHRVFEQRAHALLAPDLDDHDALLEVRASVRRGYRDWANSVNRSFYELCVAHGPLPGRSLRQRAIYEDVVQPRFEEGGKTAFFMVDALRFEMAQGLAEELRREKYRVRLEPRLAELPTETSVGMNALAPVEEGGRLHAVLGDHGILGFRRKEFQVCNPDGRVRAIGERSLGQPPVDLELEAFQDMSLTQLKRQLAGKPSLVVVRSRQLDTAGEHNLHLGTFDQTLALVRSAISLLSQAGVDRFVVTADHGFLMQDGTTDNVPFGASKRVPSRRHAFLDAPSGMTDVLEVRLSALEVDAPRDAYLVFAPDTAVWKKSEGVAPFVHGGNSLQERVIPVLEIARTVVRGRTTSKYEVVARPEPSHLGRQRLKIAVRLQDRETATLGFLAPKTISLALRVPSRPDLVVSVLDAGPPARLDDGRVLMPPNRDEVLVEFEIGGAFDDKVRVEVFHPDAQEDVVSKVVEGFFDVAARPRPRRSSDAPTAAARPAERSPLPPAAAPTSDATGAQSWRDLVADEGYRQVLAVIEERRSINEAELAQVLGSPRRVRAFAREFDRLVLLLPFGVEVLTVNGMKAYGRRD